MNILVTGGAGFIGTHFIKRLLREGAKVTVLDNFSDQVHGGGKALSKSIEKDVRLFVADVRDPEAWSRAMPGHDAVVHLAAETGTGQSMYEVSHYESVNIAGTANAWQYLVNNPGCPVQAFVVASSRAVYGEGAYDCLKHGVVFPAARERAVMEAGNYEPSCPYCGGLCTPRNTSESAPLRPCSWYGLTKQVQEQMSLMFGQALGISTFALRYQNVYGPGQSLNNPYTGILAVFSTQAMLNRPIQIFEDGKASRDFVHVDDVVDATWRCLTPQKVCNIALNVGSGQATTVAEVASSVKDFFDSRSEIQTTGAFRVGDIRYNVADISAATAQLGFNPRWQFNRGVTTFLEWASTQQIRPAGYEASLQAMKEKGLLHG